MAQLYLQSDIEEIARGIEDIRDKLEGRTILFSGGGGFLGRYFSLVIDHLNRSALATPCKLIMLDNLITATAENDGQAGTEGVSFMEHDIIEPLTVDERLDYVVHAAGIASPYYYRAYPLKTLDVGITGTRNMLEIARENGARFMFFSSSEIYGDPEPQHVPTQESYMGRVSCQGPRACYDESKRVGETLCSIYHAMHGLSTNIVRPFNVYGPGMKENDYRVLSNFGSRIKGGRPLKVYGDGRQTRTFCYVTDAMIGFMRLMILGVPGETYNIGNPEPEVSMLELVQHVEAVVDRDMETHLIEYPDSYPGGEPTRRCPDIRKARIHLGYEPQVPLRAGLKRFFDWAMDIYTGNP
ncbi:NAD-dependent epimerase/dehydratase family protein [Salidesulfovibrio brasiliensis]|uniref:NAD-dependent epimerase/dehydratase family protein n=1 Tax=Salidesulfovibrio brasiliensis TaxID=221711 RepID=UPI0006D1B3B6|nr:NAD-dependent epimerase/dehydratase family protein [Salidesulfovibrio brasiliensis]